MTRPSLRNVFQLGFKEFRSLSRDVTMMMLIVWAFSMDVYTQSAAMPDALHKASIAIVDEDRSALSEQLIAAFRPPHFTQPQLISLAEMDRGLDNGHYTFVLDIPPNFQRDISAGRSPTIQLNVDATRQSQAMTGTGYVQNIVNEEVTDFVRRARTVTTLPAELAPRVMFNANLLASWFGGVAAVINNITMLSIMLTGAALIREREHGTIEHLLVMPLTPLEIMAAKVWSMGLVVLLTSVLSLALMVKGVLGIGINGSLGLFALGTLLYLFSTTSLGILMATVARSMPQFGLLAILTLLPLMILSGAVTPVESMPQGVRWLMSLTPTPHFVSFAQAILFRNAGLDVVWPEFLTVAVLGALFFGLAHHRLRQTIGTMQG